ncbi:MAG TPA: DUF4254 domain-containing protein [Pirellulaceae bacterium]|nr:DUF4254 domain-containing protein [Pirellulaceae bacterium]
MKGIHLADITRLHREQVVRWHERDVDNPYDGLLGIACRQMSYNFLLWHEEDVARSRDVSDARIAQVKRAIDGYNQQRNDWIEKLDDWITERLAEFSIAPADDAPQNTETLGSTIDRLSILALRIYHLEEQRDRADATAEHRESVSRKLAVALLQLEDLSRAAQQLADDLFAGRKRHKTYRALKMYNDPTLNPYLYQARKEAA